MRILFVDDEQHVLDGLRRMLHGMRREWELGFATGGREALERLERERFDVVVSDMRMPGMDGAALLSEVRSRHPEVIRIILSGHSDQEMVLRSVGSTHQYLAKPCDPDVLKETIARAAGLRVALESNEIKKLVSGLRAVPSMPALYAELVAALADPDVPLKRVATIVGRDPGMATQILRLVNSAYFGLPANVSSVTSAINLLGLGTISSLVLAAHIFEWAADEEVAALRLGDIWSHCLGVAMIARLLADDGAASGQQMQELFTAGLVHDAGQLILGRGVPKAYAEVMRAVRDGTEQIDDAERRVIGVTHAEVGAYLFNLWGLPTPIIEATAFHHDPARCPAPGFSPVLAVHVADVLERETGSGHGHAATRLDVDYLADRGFGDALPRWRERVASVLGAGASSR